MSRLESNAIKAAVERLRYMQKRIMRSREVLPKNSTGIQFPYIRELSGEEWKNMEEFCKEIQGDRSSAFSTS